MIPTDAKTKGQLAQAALQGAGETDTLRGQFMAVRNWDANQADVNRSYFDTTRSINSSLQDLNSDVRQQRVNLATYQMVTSGSAYRITVQTINEMLRSIRLAELSHLSF